MDASVYLDESISTGQVANKLLLSTLVSANEAIDFQPCLNALKYELLEVDTRLSKLAADHPEKISEISQTFDNINQKLDELEPYYDDALLQIDRINSEFLEPLARTKTLHKISGKLFETAHLARDLAGYMENITVIYTIDEALSGGSTSAESLSKSADSMWALESLLRRTPSLGELDLVSRSQSLVTMSKQRVVRCATDLLKQTTSSRNVLKFSLQALNTLRHDTSHTLQVLLNDSILTHAAHLRKSAFSGSFATFESQLRLTAQAGTHFYNIETALGDISTGRAPSLERSFWQQLSAKTGRHLRTANYTSSDSLRGLSANKEKFLEALEKYDDLRQAFSANIKDPESTTP